MAHSFEISIHLAALAFKCGLHERATKKHSQLCQRVLSIRKNVWPQGNSTTVKPSDVSVQRWFNGHAISEDNLVYLCSALSVVTGGKPNVTPDMLKADVDDFATAIYLDQNAFSEWQRRNKRPEQPPKPATGQEKDATPKLSAGERLFLERHQGISFCYRFHLRERKIRRSVSILRPYRDQDGIQIIMLGPNSQPWGGRLELSDRTLMAKLTRKEGATTRFNFLTLYNHDGRVGPQRYMYGLRTRLSDGDFPQLAAYRVFFMRKPELDDEFLHADGEDLMALQKYSNDFAVDGEPLNSIAKILEEPGSIGTLTAGAERDGGSAITTFYLDMYEIEALNLRADAIGLGI